MPKVAISITERERHALASALVHSQFGPEQAASVVAAQRELDLADAMSVVDRVIPMSADNSVAKAFEVSQETADFLAKLVEARAVRAGWVILTFETFLPRLKASLSTEEN